MLKFHNILVPTDFSEESRAAFDYAKKMANVDDTRIHFLHIIELTVYPINIGLSTAAMEEMKQKHYRDADTRLKEIADEFEKDGYSAEIAVVHGKSDDGILKYIEDNNIDVVCMGTHGRSGFEHLMIGSTTEKIIRKAECPVLSVKKK
jgi:nucleotide-binding universal stress UspA family protein